MDEIIARPSFESCLPIIDRELAKRKSKWSLSSIAWMDYDDISQIIRLHIYQKWEKYDPAKPLKPWVSMVIQNQLRNLIRNHYTNYTRPCLRCAAAVDNDGCKIYKEQCEDCPLYAYWKKTRQPAVFIKLPVSIENHTHEVHEIPDCSNHLPEDILKLHEIMKRVLKPIEFKVYESLYIDQKEEHEVAKSLGFISNEKGRSPGYKQLKNIQKAIIQKARAYIDKEGLTTAD